MLGFFKQMDAKRDSIKDIWFYFPIFILGAYLIIRLINQSQMLWTFPLDSKNDTPTYIIFLYWLKVYGYHGFVPQWLNGFILFDVYPPGWVFSAYPIYLLTNDLLYTAYISLIINYAIAAVVIYLFGRSQRMSFAKLTAFFALFFISPMAVGDFIKQGRMPEMLAWLLFLALSAIVFYYKDKKTDWKFLWCAPLYAALIITHHVELILFSFVVLGLLLTRKNIKEISMILITFIFGVLLSSFWLITFLRRLNDTAILGVNFGKWLLDFSGGFQLGNIALIAMPLAMLLVFYFYWMSHNFSKRELLFFSPALILSVLVLFRLTLFIPILKNVYPDPYQLFIMLFTTYFFLKTRYEHISKRIKNIAIIVLILLPVMFITVSMLHTPWFVRHSPLSEEMISILPEIDGKFITLGPFPPDDAFQASLTAYGSIYFGLESSAGYNYVQANPEHWNNILELGQSVIKEDCNEIRNLLEKTKTTDVLAYEKTCGLMDSCGLYKKIKKEHFCLYQTK